MTKILDNKTDVLGIYAVRSPYHKGIYYLPFIILSYDPSDNTYHVLTVEYKGLKCYKVNTCYLENSIKKLIASGIITKKANPDNIKRNKEASELISRYSNAENQVL